MTVSGRPLQILQGSRGMVPHPLAQSPLAADPKPMGAANLPAHCWLWASRLARSGGHVPALRVEEQDLYPLQGDDLARDAADFRRSVDD